MSQDEQLDACRGKVMEILTSDEAITFSVAQTPIAGLKPDIVVLTNRRFILDHLFQELRIGLSPRLKLWQLNPYRLNYRDSSCSRHG